MCFSCVNRKHQDSWWLGFLVVGKVKLEECQVMPPSKALMGSFVCDCFFCYSKSKRLLRKVGPPRRISIMSWSPTSTLYRSQGRGSPQSTRYLQCQYMSVAVLHTCARKRP